MTTAACSGSIWVLDTLLTRFPKHDVLYSQDEAGREVDFVVRRTESHVDLAECKVNPDEPNAAPLAAFRQRHPTAATTWPHPSPASRIGCGAAA